MPGWDEAAPRRKADVFRHPAGNETVLYDAASDAIHILNATALAVWEVCDGQHTPDQIADHLRSHFAAAPPGRDIRTDVETALTTLEREGLIQRS